MLGPFRVDEEIGHGGMGRVFRGEHVRAGVPVAIKVVAEAFARREAFRAAFREEVRAVASLDHPGVVLVFDHGVVDAEAAARSAGALAADAPYLVMELCAHGTLADVGRPDDDASALTWPWLRGLLLDLLDALSHSHARGVVHRDIKPGNVMLGGPGAASSIKLTDFGIAHRTDEGAPAPHRVVTGTPHYMAPEQIHGALHALGPWTDLYAVGCLSYRLAGGRPPFWEPDLTQRETLRRHLSAPVPPLQSRIPVPAGFDAWLRGLLAKSTAARFRSGADAAAALLDLAGPAAAGVAAPDVGADAPTRVYTVVLERTVAWRAPALDPTAAPAAGPAPPRRIPAFPPSWRAAAPPRRSAALAGAGLGLFALRPAPLVGRERERDALWAALGAVHAARAPRLVLLRGAPGVGKKRLADWLATRAREVGAASVLTAHHAAAPGVAAGLGPMLARFLRTAGLPRAEAMRVTTAALQRLGGDEGDAPALTELTHPLGDGADDGTPRVRFASAQERHRTLERFLAALARERPVVLRIDDAPWAPDALAFVEHVAAAALPVLCLLGASDDALAAGPAPARLAALTARADAITLALTPLADDRHVELVDGLLGLAPELSAQVARRTAGNPLFAVQLVGDWVQRGLLEVGAAGFALRPGARAALPDDIHALWLGRVTRALDGSPAALSSVERAAVLGHIVAAAEWARAAGADGLPGPDALAPALELHGLLERDGPGWAFVHGMLVESLARHAREGGRWEAHHRAAAAALGGGPRAPGTAARIASHLEGAGDVPGALAPALAAAQEHLEAGEHAAALALLDRRDAWVDRLALDADDPRRVAGVLRRGAVLGRMARVSEATPLVERAEALARARGSADLLAEAGYARARLSQMAGETSEAVRRYYEARRRFAAIGDGRGVARCDHGAAAMLLQMWRLAEARPRFEAALAGFAACGDRWARSGCLFDFADLVSHQDRAAGLALMVEAEAEAEAVGNRLTLASACLVRGLSVRADGGLDEAEALFTRCAALLSALGTSDVAVARANLGMVALIRRDFARATALFEEVLASFSATGREGYLCFTHVQLLACRAAARDWDRFDAHAAAAEAILLRTGLCDDDIALAAEIAGEVASAAGEPGRAARAGAIATAQRAALAAGRGAEG
jgi:serine/threonine protein kinase